MCGGGGVIMLHNILHEKIYRALRLGGGEKCLCTIPSILYTGNHTRDRINPDGYHARGKTINCLLTFIIC